MTEMKVWSSAEKWSLVKSSAVAAGSQAQAANVLEMAIQDILALHARLDELGDTSREVRPISTHLVYRR